MLGTGSQRGQPELVLEGQAKAGLRKGDIFSSNTCSFILLKT